MLIMSNRDVRDKMSPGRASVLTTVLKLIDKYDLYEEVSYPKHHKQSDVPDIYRITAETKIVIYYLTAFDKIEPDQLGHICRLSVDGTQDRNVVESEKAEAGDNDPEVQDQVKRILNKAVRSDSPTARFTGFALSTAMSMPETVKFLKSGKINAKELDALICSGGSEMYYPGTYAEEDGKSIKTRIMQHILIIDG
ncbi:hypothetical protein Scep_014231 [Stephania cephalantha]|uniref:Uncharacterized protein n=1 Tax=Stephania cephalantha TaxID=152367 RepID=A0AAP0J263_9MAGN